jgi:uncharacterized protein YdcH (DUF465 family)
VKQLKNDNSAFERVSESPKELSETIKKEIN